MNGITQVSIRYQTESNTVLENFRGITLPEMDGVKLFNRFDTKYWLHRSQLSGTLHSVAEDYFVLDINGIQSYRNIYFDTPDDTFYLVHHNEQAGRIKSEKGNM